MRSIRWSTMILVAMVSLGSLTAMTPVMADDWAVHVWGSPYANRHVPRYGHGYRYGRSPYYPYYRSFNPIVRQDRFGHDGYTPDGTYHSEDVVEDRHASYYSPGRNHAITRPRTTVRQYQHGNTARERERTSWIGADGRPHSTTIDRITQVDPWGNTHTDTHVTLKKKAAQP